MAIVLTEEQIQLRDLVRDFMAGEVKPYISEFDEKGEFPLEIYRKSFELGFHCLDIPEGNGGIGLDNKTMCVILEEIGKVEPAMAITMLCTSLAMKCVLVGKNQEQIQRVADILMPGGFGAFCLTEPDSGSDAASLRTSVVKDGDDYVLNGSKCFSTNGGYADVYIVFATLDRKLGAKGICAFIVEKGTPGLSVGKHENKMGLRLSNTCDVIFQDVRVPAKNLLGKEGEGFKIAMEGLDEGRAYNGSIAVGICQGAVDACVRYAKERRTFGVPIIQHQAVGMMLADMEIYTEAARQLAYNAMSMADEGKKITKEAAICKCFCADAAMKVTTDAVQIMGGYGYSKEYPVEKLMRDAKIFQIFEGTNQIQRLVILKEMAR
ncbi:acyl-CoA dehydrogenase family protein [Papillibacter cinnamivorans]|uniref:Butyryl-CoA dehydrogenase n=1 Tax=Papillibacter cinnamivorans DSM 12816 TaxID=1122930 RepID=A0A1W1ZL45_9FIRM|nr:acyl-CoA dehydrogenase family protein [Papillibacter cinnamivorans]SMC49159.1 butyryl-CoA dehydrogenase [Papillibacter cinnamivorans DSM 12816]